MKTRRDGITGNKESRTRPWESARIGQDPDPDGSVFIGEFWIAHRLENRVFDSVIGRFSLAAITLAQKS